MLPNCFLFVIVETLPIVLLVEEVVYLLKNNKMKEKLVTGDLSSVIYIVILGDLLFFFLWKNEICTF